MIEKREQIVEFARLLSEMAKDEQLMQTVDQIAQAMITVYRSGHKTVFCGNGGSAAEAQHLAAELSGKFKIDRKPIPAEACHVNPSFVTAISNDYDFTRVYARYIEGFCKKGDLLFGLSTSGTSKNIIEAFIKANEMGLITVALTGSGGGVLAGLASHCIRVPSADVPRIQEVHLMLGHLICEQVERELFATENQD